MSPARSRRATYQDGQTPAWLKRLAHFLARRYGTPEGYGLCFNLGRELWGSAWRCKDRGRMVCFDHVRIERTGRIETLVTIRRVTG